MKTRNEISEIVGQACSLAYDLNQSTSHPKAAKLDTLLMGLQDGLEPTLTEIEEHKKADLYDMLWAHITKELEKDPREPESEDVCSSTLESQAEAMDRWIFWARIWYALRERIDAGRYPDAIRSPTQPDEVLSVTDMTNHELLVAYYG